MRRHKRFFTLLFLIYFLTFAVSPLSYAQADSEAPAKGELSWLTFPLEKTIYVSKNVGVFLWELICSHVAPSAAATDDAPVIRILIKKKRALVRSSSEIVFLPAEDSTSKMVRLSALHRKLASVVVHSDVALPYKGFYHSPSGLSPPSA